jgi:molybdopterin synthase catalytic subunit
VHTWLKISAEPINESALIAATTVEPTSGAVVRFLGFVRSEEETRSIRALEYECFEQMATHQFEVLFNTAGERWPLQSLRLVHRIGTVPVGEPSLWLEVIAPHRQEALAACQWLIDQLKQVVPIWKKPIE